MRKTLNRAKVGCLLELKPESNEVHGAKEDEKGACDGIYRRTSDTRHKRALLLYALDAVR